MPSSYSAAWSSSDVESGSEEERRAARRSDYETLERPSDCQLTDDEEEKPDRFSSTKNIPLQYLTRQRTIYENDWPRSIDSRRQTNDYAQSSFVDIRSDQTLYFNSPHYQSTMKNLPSKIPVRTVEKANSGAFRFFTADDRRSNPSASAGNTPLPKAPSDDDEEEEEEVPLKEEELKLKLKEQKRYGKETGQLLNQLHENYNQLLEKYAQAENTIDQLRFQPKLFNDSSPPVGATQAVQVSLLFVRVASLDLCSSSGNHSLHSTTDNQHASGQSEWNFSLGERHTDFIITSSTFLQHNNDDEKKYVCQHDRRRSHWQILLKKSSQMLFKRSRIT